jgi:hypothetical protein
MVQHNLGQTGETAITLSTMILSHRRQLRGPRFCAAGVNANSRFDLGWYEVRPSGLENLDRGTFCYGWFYDRLPPGGIPSSPPVKAALADNSRISSLRL